MLKEKHIPQFEYYEAKNKLSEYFSEMNYDIPLESGAGRPCEHCGTYYFDFELIPAKSSKKKKTVYYCPDCAVDKVDWCNECGYAYEMINPEEDFGFCPDCMEVLGVRGD